MPPKIIWRYLFLFNYISMLDRLLGGCNDEMIFKKHSQAYAVPRIVTVSTSRKNKKYAFGNLSTNVLCIGKNTKKDVFFMMMC